MKHSERCSCLDAGARKEAGWLVRSSKVARRGAAEGNAVRATRTKFARYAVRSRSKIKPSNAPSRSPQWCSASPTAAGTAIARGACAWRVARRCARLIFWRAACAWWLLLLARSARRLTQPPQVECDAEAEHAGRQAGSAIHGEEGQGASDARWGPGPHPRRACPPHEGAAPPAGRWQPLRKTLGLWRRAASSRSRRPGLCARSRSSCRL